MALFPPRIPGVSRYVYAVTWLAVHSLHGRTPVWRAMCYVALRTISLPDRIRYGGHI